MRARAATLHSEETSSWSWARLSGPVVTLAVVVAVEILSERQLPVVNLGLILLAPVVYSVMVGGIRWASASMVIALGYYAYHYSPAGSALKGYTAEEAERIVTTTVVASGVVFVLALLQSRLGDLVERKRALGVEAESERRRSNALLARITDGFIAVDRHWRYTFVNPRAEAMLGTPSSDLLGKTVWEVFPDLVGSVVEGEYQRALAEGVPARFEYFYAPLGTWFEIRAYPSEDGLSLFLGDVTAERDAARALAARLRQQAAVAELGQEALRGADVQVLSETAVRLVAEGLDAPFATVLEAHGDGPLSVRAGTGWDTEGEVLVESGEGSQAGHTLGSTEPVVVHDMSAEKRFAVPAALREHGVVSGISVVIEGTPGQPFGVLTVHTREKRAFSKDDAHFMRAVANVLADAIARRRAREALFESETRFRQIAENVGAVLFMTDPNEARVYYVSPAYETVWGRSAESLYQAPLSWLSAVHEEDRSRVDAALAAMTATGRFDETFRIVRPDGAVRWIRDRVFPVPHHDGIERVVGIAEDITDGRLAEERARALLREQSAREAAEARVRARDDVLAVVSHNLRSPLSAVVYGAELLQSEVESRSLVRTVEGIVRAASRMNRLIDDLLMVSMMDAGGFTVRPTPLDTESLLREVAEAFSPEAERNALSLEVDASEALPRLRADRHRAVQALSNLVGNALKFTPPGGRVRLRARTGDEGVEIVVEDTGAGIAEEALPRLFDRFWQARKDDRRGVGLGLAITKGIVDAHGGRIWVESRLGEGTAFHLTLPVAG